MGFTMSLSIAGLALRTDVLLSEAKLAILVASAIAGVGGRLVLRGAAPGPRASG